MDIHITHFIQDFIKDFEKSIHKKFKNVVLSIGTAPAFDSERQIFLDECKEKTIYIAIDQQFENIKHKLTLKNFAFVSDDKLPISIYFNEQNEVLLFIVRQNLVTSYEIGAKNVLLKYNYKFPLIGKHEREWKLLMDVLLNYIEMDKNIYINNHAYTNDRVNGKLITRGIYYDYFPELGYVLAKLYCLTGTPNIYVYDTQSRGLISIKKTILSRMEC